MGRRLQGVNMHCVIRCLRYLMLAFVVIGCCLYTSPGSSAEDGARLRIQAETGAKLASPTRSSNVRCAGQWREISGDQNLVESVHF